MEKRKIENRVKKFVVWLSNRTDHRDDDWMSVWAFSASHARTLANTKGFDKVRFTMGKVVTAKQFKQRMGFGA